MSGALTLAPQVQAALLAAIAARVPQTTSVALGYPPGGLAAEQVWISGDYKAQNSWVATGWTQRGEEATTEVRVAVLQTTATFTDAQSQALLIAGCVAAAILADPTLGGLVDRCEIQGNDGQEAIPDEHQRQYGVTLTVFWAATITA